MGIEIERKFLLRDDSWRTRVSARTLYRQAYLHFQEREHGIFRVRTAGEKGFLTLKGAHHGCSRSEYEYEIPFEDGNFLLDNLAEKPIIEKKRYRIPQGKFVWEIDEFFGENQGLIVAEIELESEDEAFDRPEWAGQEVTGDPRYFNSNLIRHPYTRWQNNPS